MSAIVPSDGWKWGGEMARALAASLTPLVYGGLFDRGYWVAPFFVSAGVMFIGALIWTFLIDPEESVVVSA